MGVRYYSLDVAKGFAIILMLLSHPFSGTYATVDFPFLITFADTVPKFVWYCILLPLGVIGNMGSFFVFISSICVTLSFLDISKKGWKVVWRYLSMKFIFAILLRGMEIFWVSWTTEYDMIETRRIQWPIVSLPFSSDIIDCIGFNSWSISLVVYLLRLVPFLRDYRLQIYILYFLSVLVTVFSRFLSECCSVAMQWSNSHRLYILEYCFSKMSSGTDQLPQLWPFGLLGAAFAILFHSGVPLSKLVWFSGIVFGVNCIIGVVFLYPVDDFITELFEPFKPEGFMFISMGVELVVVLICIFIFDDKRRSPMRRRGSLKRTTYMRRLNTLSLTIFVLEKWLNKNLLVLFELFFGELIDTTKKEILWTWPVVILFSVVVVFIVIGVARIWEYFEFRYSVEHQINRILLWLFDKQYNKVDYKANIYGPMNEVQQEIDCGHRDDDVELRRPIELVEGKDAVGGLIVVDLSTQHFDSFCVC